MKRATVQNILSSADAAAIAIAGAVTVYTKSFKVAFGEYFSLAYKASSASGSPDLKIELEAAVNDAVPTTEGSSDTNYVEPENQADIESSLTTETWHIKSLSPPVSCYLRLKITGAAGNNADTIFYAKLHKQEEY